AVLVLLSASLVGCTTTQKFMAGGAVVGATTGGIWAHNHGLLSAAEGALVGAATGAAVGGLVGNVIDYNQLGDLEAQLAEANSTSDELRARNQELQNQLNDLRRQLDQCRQENESLRARIAELEGRGARIIQEEVT